MTHRLPPGAAQLGIESRRMHAVVRAQSIAVRIRELLASGLNLRQVSAALTDEGVPGLQGGQWRPDKVTRCLNLAGGSAPAPDAHTPDPVPDPVPDIAYRPRRGVIV